MSKIFILMGNPDAEQTLGAELADEYAKAAQAGGHEVRRVNIADLQFDPILHKGYKTIQQLEPDLVKVQDDMKWADHFVLIYPLWWAGMPALLKGMWDRLFLPGFAFHFHPNGMGWDKLMKGKSARVVITSKNWPLLERVLFGDFTNEISRALLSFSGYKVRLTEIGRSEQMSESQKAHWMKKIGSLAERAR